MSGKAGALLAAGERELRTVDPPTDSTAMMFERWASDPNVSVEKIERLMTLWERGEARKAEAAFNAAMSEAQAKMRPVAADANNPQTKSKYASYVALDNALRPIYTGEGFGLSFDTGESPMELHVRVLCYATHRSGHSRTYHVDMPADGKGAKGGDVMTRTHAVGAALSYGARYLLRLVFNVAVGEDDNDGNGASAKPQKASAAPAGFEDWWTDFQATADNGTLALERAWQEANKSDKTKAFLKYAGEAKADGIRELKKKASRVAAS